MDTKELLEIALAPCRSCGCEETSVRVAKYGWFFVGCTACGNKTLCDKAKVQQVIETTDSIWRHTNVMANFGIMFFAKSVWQRDR